MHEIPVIRWDEPKWIHSKYSIYFLIILIKLWISGQTCHKRSTLRSFIDWLLEPTIHWRTVLCEFCTGGSWSLAAFSQTNIVYTSYPKHEILFKNVVLICICFQSQRRKERHHIKYLLATCPTILQKTTFGIILRLMGLSCKWHPLKSKVRHINVTLSLWDIEWTIVCSQIIAELFCKKKMRF